MAEAKRLSAIEVARKRKPGRYAAGDGLYLQVSTVGTKAWIFRYQLDGKARHMGLGSISLLSLAEARECARDARKQLLNGIDPIAAREAQRQQDRFHAARAMTFKAAAEKYIAAHKAGWKNAKHGAQWGATLEAYAYPHFGDVSVAAVDVALVTKALEPIWTQKPETAGRVRGRIESILDWAAARGYRTGENPARWRGHLEKLLPARSKVRRVKHHAALPYDELPAFMADLRDRDSISARALEFTIFTAARTGEAIGAQRVEIRGNVWTVPAARMKSGKEHRVPLCDRAVSLLEALPSDDSPYLFIGGHRGKPLSNMAMAELLKGMQPGITVHGFRSTFRDWAAERTAYPNHIVEAALAHAIPSGVEAASRRGDLFENRKRLMDDWAGFCESRPAHAEKVVTFKSRPHG